MTQWWSWLGTISTNSSSKCVKLWFWSCSISNIPQFLKTESWRQISKVRRCQRRIFLLPLHVLSTFVCFSSTALWVLRQWPCHGKYSISNTKYCLVLDILPQSKLTRGSKPCNDYSYLLTSIWVWYNHNKCVHIWRLVLTVLLWPHTWHWSRTWHWPLLHRSQSWSDITCDHINMWPQCPTPTSSIVITGLQVNHQDPCWDQL